MPQRELRGHEHGGTFKPASAQIRRMPVIDDQGHPIGIISLNDIARAASAGKVPAKDVASTLAAVGAPRALLAAAA